MNNQTLPIPDPSKWYTVGAAAYMLGVSRRTISRMIDAGTLTAYTPSVGYQDGKPEAGPILLWGPQVSEVFNARLTAGIRR